MKQLTQTDLDWLIETTPDGPAVSIYCPMVEAGRETRTNPTHFKNGLQKVRSMLIHKGMDEPEIDAFLAPAEELLADRAFWQHQKQGLATFIADGEMRIYRLPIAFTPQAMVSTRFHIKPLVDYFSLNGRFFLLSISQNDVRFFEGSRHQTEQIEVEEMPTSLDEALAYDDPERQLQLHATVNTAGQDQAAIFHGHGDVEEEDRTQILRFCQHVSQHIEGVLEAGPNVPLVLAGVDYLLHIFREACDYEFILEEQISGNPEQMSAEALHTSAVTLLHPYWMDEISTAIDQYHIAAEREQAVSGVETVTSSAFQGRVDTLFVAAEKKEWGNLDRETGTLQLDENQTAENEDLLDVAVAETLRNGGQVFMIHEDDKVEMPAEQVAAVLRF